LQAVGAQQPRHPLAGAADAVAAQLGVDPGRAVGAARALVDDPDLAQQPGVLAAALGGVMLLGHEAVEGRGGDLQHPEDGLDPELVTMSVHEGHDRRRVGSSSWAK
jgi:hypothetical protein